MHLTGSAGAIEILIHSTNNFQYVESKHLLWPEMMRIERDSKVMQWIESLCYLDESH